MLLAIISVMYIHTLYVQCHTCVYNKQSVLLNLLYSTCIYIHGSTKIILLITRSQCHLPLLFR